MTNAQEIITASGDYFFNTNGSISITLGEPATETFSNSDNIVTQGFQQSKLEAMEINESTLSDLPVFVFPNPTSQSIKIKVDITVTQKLSYKLYETEGKLISNEEFFPPEIEIDLTKCAPATYILKVYTEQKEIKCFKIINQ